MWLNLHQKENKQICRLVTSPIPSPPPRFPLRLHPGRRPIPLQAAPPSPALNGILMFCERRGSSETRTHDVRRGFHTTSSSAAAGAIDGKQLLRPQQSCERPTAETINQADNRRQVAALKASFKENHIQAKSPSGPKIGPVETVDVSGWK